MKTLGKSLLRNGRVLTRYMDGLATSVIEHVEARKAEGEDWSPEEYYADLDATFGLKPLVIGELRSVLAYVDPQQYRSGGEVKTGYVAEARVPYTGSSILWSVPPGLTPGFRYRGVVALASAGLRTYLPDMDLRAFEEEVQAELARTRPALAELEPKVRAWDEQIRHRIRCSVTFLS